MKPYFTFCIAFSLTVLHCTTTEMREPERYRCTEHKIHDYENREELCACFGINPADYDSYQFFYLEDSTKNAQDLPAITESLQDQMERKIVSIVMHKIEKAMGKHLYKFWKFDETNIPVNFRHFTKKEKNSHSAVIVAAMTKYHLSPRGIIMYLPLEYKMHILEKQKDE
ncbi:MAG: hypothetical protein N2316_13940 [Spirochaetes bacterium]|nr:hypothetical protein [Spirochaetota bacterium]